MTAVEQEVSQSPEPLGKGELNTKLDYRKQVWNYLKSNRLSVFPFPPFGRIPNYKGAELAAAKLQELEEFKEAKIVQVNPDKTLEFSRMLVLEQQKELCVPIPRLENGLLKKLSVSGEESLDLSQVVKRLGMETNGKLVEYEEALHIDMLVLGSVAVSKEGRRIGKGRGFTDLEYGILRELKAINDHTVIVTTVHDCQVFDSIPEDIFQDFDVPVDYILTPTQIIKVQTKLPRPQGIIWSELSQNKIDEIHILQKLFEKYSSETTEEIVLKPESRRRRRPRQSSESHKNRPVPRRKSQEPRKRFRKVQKEKPSQQETAKPRIRKHRYEFSLRVENIHKTARVKDLKQLLHEKGIKPQNITWHGMAGYCFLHYAKPSNNNQNQNKRELQAEQEEPTEEDVPLKSTFQVDNVIDILQKLKIGPEAEQCLSVKMMEPITRIETTDVSAV